MKKGEFIKSGENNKWMNEKKKKTSIEKGLKEGNKNR